MLSESSGLRDFRGARTFRGIPDRRYAADGSETGEAKRGEMTASHQLTPSQARYIQEHKERRQRFAAKAKPDKPVICLSASARAAAFEPPVIKLLSPEVPETPAQWAGRQIQRYQPWFSIEAEIDPPADARPTIGLVQRKCCLFYEIALSDMTSESRMGPIVRARQIAMFLAKEMTFKSLPEIGRRFGNRDHTTVLHAVRKIGRLESSDNDLAEELATLREQIKEAI